jgi:O-antigen/teichoic acid export membrane protein
MPANLLDGIGRPDLRAKIFLSYVGIYVGLAWFLIGKMGIVGAALAWAFRGCLELALFFGVSWRLLRFSRMIFIENGFLKGLIVFASLAAITPAITTAVGKSIWIQGIVTVICLILFASVVWSYVLDQQDKRGLKAMFLEFAYNRKDAQ